MDTLIIQKFGGTSLESIERISHVATLIAEEVSNGNRIVVVVSAMGSETDRLLGLAKELSYAPDPQELDVLLASGEQVSCALVTLALHKLKIQAVSCLGWQVPIVSDGVHTNARISHIQEHKIQKILSEKQVVVVPGFQGISEESGRVTTFGRGGSDVTAVAMASALKAQRCDIYTDVDGIYTADPRLVSQAQKVDTISYEAMLELASLGAGVLHPRAVELAAKNHVCLRVLSSFEKPGDNSGTWIQETSSGKALECGVVQGIALQAGQACVRLKGEVSLENVFQLLTKARLKPDAIQQQAGQVLLVFSESDADRAYRLLSDLRESGKVHLFMEKGLSKVSLVGVGLQQDMNVVNTLLRTLSQHRIETHAMISSETKISVLMEDVYGELAIRLLHQEYGLKTVNPSHQHHPKWERKEIA
ncbi:MAG: aspartate kinase [bacterium]|nr:aspartate kinase [bacterium]